MDNLSAASLKNTKPTRVIVIGGGISGMGAAMLLQPHYEVTLLEAETRLGGHARTKMIEIDRKTQPVDTGFIVYNEPNYPQLTALFNWLKVSVEKTDMSFALSRTLGEKRGIQEWSARNVWGLFGQRRNLFKLSFWKFLLEITRFNRTAKASLKQGTALTLGQWLLANEFSEKFQQDYLLPMGGAIWSTPIDKMREFPAQTFFQFFENHGLLSIADQPQWHTVTGGSQEYVDKVAEKLGSIIQLDAKVAQLSKRDETWHVVCENGQSFDAEKIVFACHGDQVLPLFAHEPDIRIQEVISAFETSENEMVLHQDTTQLPMRKQCWASWNYLSYQSDNSAENQKISLSYWMNLLQNFTSKVAMIVTLNPVWKIDESKVFDRKVFRHPQFDQKAVNAQTLISDIQGIDNLYFCGAYTRYGFHEDGLLSAVRVGEAMGLTPPWS